MACLRPLHIINPSKRIDLYNGVPFRLDVPCGSCSECQKARHNEWLFRAYYQSQDCFDNGGFILYDTLTYAPHNLPRLSSHIDNLPSYLNYGCFDRRHIALFIKRLRSRLSRLGYPIESSLKYFISSEYGTDEGCTHRPHYHVLFYVYDSTIDPIMLSHLVSDCWIYGRTDGVRYKGAAYVRNNVFTPSSGHIGIHRVCKYVTKYVMKDSDFEKEIKNRMFSCLKLKNIDIKSFDGKKFVRDWSRYACQFHLQSKGFGAQFMNYNDYNTILKDGFIVCPDDVTTLKRLPLPMYMRRKLFYEIVRDFRGVRVWQLNELGIAWKNARVIDNVTTLSRRFVDWYRNLHNYVSSDYLASVQNYVIDLLDSRTFSDFALYIALYRGRICVDRCLLPPSLDSWLCSLYESPCNCDYRVNYTNMYDRHHFGSPFIALHYLGDNTIGYSTSIVDYISQPNFKHISPSALVCSVESFSTKFVINESSYYAFRDFDKLFELYCLTLVQFNDKKQAAFDYVQHIQSIYKQFKS